MQLFWLISPFICKNYDQSWDYFWFNWCAQILDDGLGIKEGVAAFEPFAKFRNSKLQEKMKMWKVLLILVLFYAPYTVSTRAIHLKYVFGQRKHYSIECSLPNIRKSWFRIIKVLNLSRADCFLCYIFKTSVISQVLVDVCPAKLCFRLQAIVITR